MDDTGIAGGGTDAVLIGGRRGSCGRLGSNVLTPVWIGFFPDRNILEEFVPVIRFYCRFELNRSACRALSCEGRPSDKRAVRRRYGDIVSGNTKRCVCRGWVGKRHTLSSPLLEGNDLGAVTCLDVGRDVHRVVLKEISAHICILDAGAGKCAVLDRHGTRRAVAIRGVAVGFIIIDCMVCVAEGLSSEDGTAGSHGRAALFFPLDLHIANLGQGRISYLINTDAVSIILILTGVCHVDLNRAVGVDGHIFFCTQTVAVTTACRIVRRSTGDVHGGTFGDGDVFLRVNAVCFLVGARAGVRHVDSHFGIALDRHIAGGIAGRKTGHDADCGIGVACCFANRECATAVRCNGDVTSITTFKGTVVDGVRFNQLNGKLACGDAFRRNACSFIAVQRQSAVLIPRNIAHRLRA